MTKEELIDVLNEIQRNRCETRTLELKNAETGCPKRLYDTLSSFSNQDDGGIIVFGVDETRNYLECGVYDPQDIQKKINEQCLQMSPIVRPLLTVVEKENKFFVAAEIPAIDISERPCYYMGKGMVKGSYVRVGDSDEPMTEYEIYSYEAFRKKYQDDIRIVQRAAYSVLDQTLLETYLLKLKSEKPNLSSLPDENIRELMSITADGKVTLSSLMLFSRYPQAFFPQLCITAVSVAGDEICEIGESGERFIDNRRIEGNIPQMLDEALVFVRKNMKIKTVISPKTGKREDIPEYPLTAVREILLNALVHRDYSVHTEGMPIQIRMFQNRIEIQNPGGIYGRLRIDQLGKAQPDTRNPVIATALEVMGLTENRYSGIPTIRRVMKEYHLPDPVFTDERGSFMVTLYNSKEENLDVYNNDLLRFLETPRTRREIADFLKVRTTGYAIQKYIDPLIKKGIVVYTIPEKPKSSDQRYVLKNGTGY